MTCIKNIFEKVQADYNRFWLQGIPRGSSPMVRPSDWLTWFRSTSLRQRITESLFVLCVHKKYGCSLFCACSDLLLDIWDIWNVAGGNFFQTFPPNPQEPNRYKLSKNLVAQLSQHENAKFILNFNFLGKKMKWQPDDSLNFISAKFRVLYMYGILESITK